MAAYTIFGSSMPFTPVVYQDGTPTIEVGTIFYTTPANGPADCMRCTGGRVFIPNDPLVTGKTITVRAYVGSLNSGTISYINDNPAAAPIQQKVTTTPASGGWCEVTWDTPFITDYGKDACYIAICYEFTDPADAGKYIAGSGLDANAIPSVDIGGSLLLAELDNGGGIADWRYRGQYVQGTNGNSFGAYYCTDIIMDDPTPAGGIAPVAAYGFNEGSGTAVADATGNGWGLTTLTSNFVSDGHHLSGITAAALNQVAFPDYVTVNSYTPITLPTSHEMTVMFWGRRDDAGGTGYTMQQTEISGVSPYWAMQLSDGTNCVFTLFPSGFIATVAVPHMPIGEWHHYAMSITPYGCHCYIDGVLVGEFKLKASYDSGNNLPCYSYGTTIDDVRIFNAALSSAAVAYYTPLTVNGGIRSGKIKHWNGTTWQAHPVKVWNGSTWAPHAIKATEDGLNFIAGKD